MKESQGDSLSSRSNSGSQGDFLEGVGPSDRAIVLIVKLVLQTAFLKAYPKPISLLLLGKPGIGKSRLVSPLSHLDYVSYVNDITPKYLVEFLERAKRGEKKFLVVPDFTSCLSHGKNTRNTLIAILRAMTEEGVTDLSAYHLEFRSDTPVRAGVITATTHASYEEFGRAWKTSGFLSRFLPFSFSHSGQTTERIMDDIDAKVPDPISDLRLRVKRKPGVVSRPSQLLRQLRVCEELLSTKTGSAPYRQQIQLNAITESLAVLRADQEITQDDIDKIHWLSNWINYDFKEV